MPYNRIRNRGSLSSYPSYYQTHYPKTCANRITEILIGPTNVADCPIGERSIMYDFVTPEFWKRSKKGEFILNDLYKVTLKRTASGSSTATHTSVALACAGPNANAVYTLRDAYFMALFCTNVGIPSNTKILDTNARQKLAQEVWTRCLAGRQKGDANFVESIAEFGKTWKMMHSPLENLQRLVRNLRASGKRTKGYRKVRAESNEFIRFASSEYLRFRYGIQPIVSDVKAAMKALQKSYNKDRKTLHESRAKGNITLNNLSSGNFSVYPYKVFYGVARAQQTTMRAVFFDRYSHDIWDEVGLTFHNLVGLPWELTRYSFVLDWFANVGDLIYANIPRVRLEELGGVMVEKDITTALFYPTSTIGTDPTNWTVSGSFSDTYQMIDTETTRYKPSFLDQGLVIKSDFRFSDWIRVADAAAVASQLLQSIGFKNR